MKLILIKFDTKEDFKSKEVEKLRGYIGNLYKDEIKFHNHKNTYEFNYQMPKIQYKLINNKLCILGMDEGEQLIKQNLLDLKELNISGKIISGFKTSVEIYEDEFEVKDELFSYKFETPWLALNNENYKKYKNGDFSLDKQLQNNLLSNFKDCGIRVDKKIMVKGNFRPIKLVMKDTVLIGFNGEFISNVYIPSYMGVGKRKSIGYGTIVSNVRVV
ncbi:hypothetical protein CHF27_006650 [Romboutsia maritimum]|uniref:DNA repair protein n=1 Tax=Romboutsia maritimum TaxID=2020948 RepID=A0A371ITH9_9FIRM|nr:CRISPR-associated endonuclease Cas6 [Romboutsia maritimum]RDY23796.1 hypothetical protein CHF27_006650 [Romboutsia maritimum]